MMKQQPNWLYFLRNKDGQQATITWPLFKRVLRYAQPYRWQIGGMLIIILITTTLGLLKPLIFRDLIDNTLPNQNLMQLNLLAFGLLMIPLISGALDVFQSRLSATVGEGVTYDLRLALYRHLQRMPFRFFTTTKTGELMSRLNNDVQDARQAISNTMIDTVARVVQLIALLIVMFALEWRLTLLGLALLPLFIPISQRSSDAHRAIARQTMNDKAAMNALMHETLNISGVLLVKLFGRHQNEVDRFDHHAQTVRNQGVRKAVVSKQFSVIMGLIGAVGTALVYWVGGYLVLQGTFSIGTIVAFTAYLTQFYSTLQRISNIPITFATALVSFERVFEVIDLPLDIDEKSDAIQLADVQGALCFENVSFAYEGAPQMTHVQRHGQMHTVEAVLSGHQAAVVEENTQAREQALAAISFTIQPGQLIALVGPSGAGKTTLTYLVPRLYDPTEGRILLDGHDLRDIALDALTAEIGIVTQETHLFHDTIHTNLLYARLDATQDEIEAACRAANIHDFIVGLSAGYQTVVGERGYRLSGGEKQRLAIARVILKDPRILILDEATSHLDSQSEALIQDALKGVMANRTSIVIAHRLSTILAADQILVLNRGRIVEHGNHDALLALDGLYAELYNTQFNRLG